MSLVSYSHTSQTLNCTSSGGPATNVTWRKDNVIIPLTISVHQQSQRVADEVTSIYYNLLSITSSNIEDHSGTFSCTVENNRGSSENYFNSKSVIFSSFLYSIHQAILPYSILVIMYYNMYIIISRKGFSGTNPTS